MVAVVIPDGLSRCEEQAQAVELAQLRERLAATEKLLGESEKAGKKAAEQHRQQQADLQKRLDTELKARQTALDKALRDAADSREAKPTLTGELKSLKMHNDLLAALLAGKK